MREIEIITQAVGLTFILHGMFFSLISFKFIPDVKPFNCYFCLSFWSAVIIGLWYLSPVVLIAPLISEYSRKILNKL